MGQDTIDRINREEIAHQHVEKYGIPPSVTGVSSRGPATDPVVIADEADLSVNSASESTHEEATIDQSVNCLLYTSPSPRDRQKSRMPSSA